MSAEKSFADQEQFMANLRRVGRADAADRWQRIFELTAHLTIRCGTAREADYERIEHAEGDVADDVLERVAAHRRAQRRETWQVVQGGAA